MAIENSLCKDYISETTWARDNAPFFIDKMPNNFIHIGLIKTILPNAKIIDTRRDPMDTCFSCFKQFFARGQLFTYSMEDLGNYYADYIRAMNHWHKVYGKDIFTIHYDDVINKTEETISPDLFFLTETSYSLIEIYLGISPIILLANSSNEASAPS